MTLTRSESPALNNRKGYRIDISGATAFLSGEGLFLQEVPKREGLTLAECVILYIDQLEALPEPTGEKTDGQIQTR